MSDWLRRAAAERTARPGTGAGDVLAAALVLALADVAGAGVAPPAPVDAVVLAGASVVEADSAARGRLIGRVDILTHNVFDPAPGSRLGALERLGNRLHIRTRVGTIRRQLLFEPGDRWSEERARETMRNLRALNYLDPVRVQAQRVADSAQVLIETRDLWTMTPRFNIASAGGHRVGSIGVTDRNVLGHGKSLALSYRDDDNGRSWHVAYDDPNLGGGHHRLHYASGIGNEGANDEINVGLPFFAEQTVRAYSAGWSRSTFVRHLYSDGAERASFDERSERVDLWIGGRRPAGRVIRRLIGAFELWDRRLGPSRLLPGAPPGFAGSEENIHIRRLAGEVVWWRPGFVEHTDVNRFTRIEDFDVGGQLGLKLGFAPRAFGSSDDEGLVRLRLDLGAKTPLGFGWAHATGSSRLRPESVERILQLEARWYSQIHSSHTFAIGASGVSGVNTPRDFQAAAGGLNGLRAYPVDAVVGQRLWRLNAEERWRFSPARWEFINLGSAVFLDAARAWGTGAADTGWFRDAGVGLRIGSRSWGLSEVMRVDVAWPIEPTRNGGNRPVLTFGSSQAF